MNSPVYATAVLANGDLVAGGAFDNVEGTPANSIARWNGRAWYPLGSGLTGLLSEVLYDRVVSAIVELPNGDIVAGGAFTLAGAVENEEIARWDGSSWSALGDGLYGEVLALAVLSNGDLVAGGNFSVIGASSITYIAKWDGSSWSALGSGLNGGVSSLVVLPNGDLVAGGGFTSAGGTSANYIARWNGSTWAALGSGMNNGVSTLAVLPSGDVVAGGLFTTAGGSTVNYIARWDGSDWTALGSGVQYFVNTLAVLSTGDLIVGGYFDAAGGSGANHAARWDGTSWSQVSSAVNFDDAVWSIAVLPNDDLAFGGSFTAFQSPNTSTSYTARRFGFFGRWAKPSEPVTADPADVATCTGSASFSVTVSGSSLVYKWQRESVLNSNSYVDLADGATGHGSTISNSGASTMSISNASSYDNTRYRCRVTSSCGGVSFSEAARLFVNSADFNNDGDVGTDADIAAFFACIGGDCCATCGSADFNGDGDIGTEADIEAFERVLGGGSC